MEEEPNNSNNSKSSKLNLAENIKKFIQNNKENANLYYVKQ